MFSSIICKPIRFQRLFADYMVLVSTVSLKEICLLSMHSAQWSWKLLRLDIIFSDIPHDSEHQGIIDRTASLKQCPWLLGLHLFLIDPAECRMIIVILFQIRSKIFEFIGVIDWHTIHHKNMKIPFLDFVFGHVHFFSSFCLMLKISSMLMFFSKVSEKDHTLYIERVVLLIQILCQFCTVSLWDFESTRVWANCTRPHEKWNELLN